MPEPPPPQLKPEKMKAPCVEGPSEGRLRLRQLCAMLKLAVPEKFTPGSATPKLGSKRPTTSVAFAAPPIPRVAAARKAADQSILGNERNMAQPSCRCRGQDFTTRKKRARGG